jgi:RNA polymerase sigma-70 factor (ECF subfamily)
MAEVETLHSNVAQRDEATDRLVAGLQRQDRSAEASLLEQYGPMIQEFAARRLGDVELAKDVMVEALAAAALGIRRFDRRITSFRAWLFGVARRHIQQEARLRARRRLVPATVQVSLERAAEEASPGDLADGLAARVDAQRTIAMLAASLSPVEMEVLTLWCIHELSLREMAHVMGRSERGVSSLLHRAKHKARERLVRNER